MDFISASSLGKTVSYKDLLDASLLYPIPRKINRDKLTIEQNTLPFKGYDLWNGFEFCWMQAGVPINALLEISIPCESTYLIESKSFKLYLFSFANTVFKSRQEVIARLEHDLSNCAKAKVTVNIISYDDICTASFYPEMIGKNIDSLDVECSHYEVCSEILSSNPSVQAQETLCSDLLKSNCLATGKPDWASVRISYTGNKIDASKLLEYLISFREHKGFHEDCVERIYMDILMHCKPSRLTVEARYTRRGGLDINPVRSTDAVKPVNYRVFRQ